IRAPFDAVVLTKNADIGDIVTPIGAAAGAQASVVTIADMDSLQVEADVSESNISRVLMGQPCIIQLDAVPKDRFAGRVHMIVPTAERSKASVLVKVSFVEKNSRILPEMSAKISFLEREMKPEEREPILLVPGSAVRRQNGQEVMFAVENGRVQGRNVTTGRKFQDRIEVLSGVKAGESVVLAPPPDLEDGDRVKTSLDE
ncbi:MAG: efflux RND transporter periplasmic adaptor subunit, partial [Desulfovibrionales bacterium]